MANRMMTVDQREHMELVSELVRYARIASDNNGEDATLGLAFAFMHMLEALVGKHKAAPAFHAITCAAVARWRAEETNDD